MERPYTPTLKDKIRKFFTGKPFPVTVDVRPEDSTIVIAKYGDGTHYEIVEYNNRTWVTELCYPIVPSNWAYLPTEIIDRADSIMNEKGNK